MATTTPLNKVERAHQLYRDGRYDDALGFYTDALAMAKSKPQKIALHSNRAACYLKLHDFKKAADECTAVLELDHKHTGALMLRAQTLVTLKEYHSALFDVNQLLELNPLSEVYLNLQARLKTQLSLSPIPEAETEEEEEEENQEETPEIAKGLEQCGLQEQNIDNIFRSINPKTDPNISYPNDELSVSETSIGKTSSELHSKGWEAIPKPKGHSQLNYSRWDRVEEGSSEDEDDDEDDDQPQYRFRVRSIGVQSVK